MEQATFGASTTTTEEAFKLHLNDPWYRFAQCLAGRVDRELSDFFTDTDLDGVHVILGDRVNAFRLETARRVADAFHEVIRAAVPEGRRVAHIRDLVYETMRRARTGQHEEEMFPEEEEEITTMPPLDTRSISDAEEVESRAPRFAPVLGRLPEEATQGSREGTGEGSRAGSFKTATAGSFKTALSAETKDGLKARFQEVKSGLIRAVDAVARVYGASVADSLEEIYDAIVSHVFDRADQPVSADHWKEATWDRARIRIRPVFVSAILKAHAFWARKGGPSIDFLVRLPNGNSANERLYEAWVEHVACVYRVDTSAQADTRTSVVKMTTQDVRLSCAMRFSASALQSAGYRSLYRSPAMGYDSLPSYFT